MSQTGMMFAFPLIPALISLIFGILEGRVVKAITVSVAGLLVNAFLIWIITGYASVHLKVFPFGDYFWLSFVPLVVFIVLEAIGLAGRSYGDGSPSALIIQMIAFVGLFVLLIGATIFNPQGPITSRPFICGSAYDQINQQFAGVLKVKQQDGYRFDVPLDQLPQRSEREAYANALDVMGQDLGGWLDVAEHPYLETINGHLYWHAELKPREVAGEVLGLDGKSFNTFFKKGGMVPGYILIDATNRSVSKPIIVLDQKIKYVYDIRFSSGQNLKAHLYYDFELPNQAIADDPGIEVMDDGRAIYTAGVLKPTLGVDGDTMDSALLMDPFTGQITTTSLADMPADVDRIFSPDYVQKYAQAWGQFSEATWCPQTNFDRRMKIDRFNYVSRLPRMAYQITFTDESKGTQIARILYVDPRTGEAIAIKPPVPLSTIESIDTLVTERVRNTPGMAKDAEADNCILTDVLGEKVVYCLLVDPDEANSLRGKHMGFAFFRARYANTDAPKVIIAPTLNEAYAKLQRQIAGDSDASPDMQKAAGVTLYKGEVSRISDLGNEIQFQLVQYPGVIFSLSKDSPTAKIMSLTKVSDTLTLDGLAGTDSKDVNVGKVCNQAVRACSN